MLSRFMSVPNEERRLDQMIVDRAFKVAMKERGRGEVTNNRGPDIERYRAGDGTGGGPGGAGAWCAVLQSYCYMTAIASLNFDGHRVRLPFKTSRGAKRLAKNMAEAGCWIDVKSVYPPTLRPGMLIAWHRLGANGVITWRGHVGMIARYRIANDELTVIEGNKNVPGARVAEVQEFTYPDGKWRRRLYGVASLVPIT